MRKSWETFQWWVTYPEQLCTRLTNWHYTREQAQERWAGRCTPDPSTREVQYEAYPQAPTGHMWPDWR